MDKITANLSKAMTNFIYHSPFVILEIKDPESSPGSLISKMTRRKKMSETNFGLILNGLLE